MSGVEYDRTENARRYSDGRGLPAEVLDRWRAAVTRHVPDRDGLDVLDLGAGTGTFARAWPTWVPCQVVALEPAAAMRAELLQRGPSPAIRVLAGRAEQLPLRAGGIDVVWISAVIHHLEDLDRGAAEIRRVLAADGVVLIRGLFADLGATPGLELIPGSDRAVAAFPTVAAIEHAFSGQELRLASVETVVDAGPFTVAEAADRIRWLRSVDTLLRQYTDAEIATGLATLDAMDPSHRLAPAALGLLTFGP